MSNVKITIKIDSNSRGIEYCVLEDRDLNPRNHFEFKSGVWVGVFNNFPIGPDNDLDIIIVARGNPRTNSTMNVNINGVDKGNFKLFQPFNRNGYGQFSESVKI